MDGLIAYALAKKYADEVGRSILDAGFKTHVEQDRSILQTTGQEKILYFIPKTAAKPSDGYDEYVYSNNAWELIGAMDVDLSSYATKNEIGELSNLPTADKSSIVSAISETFTSVSNGKSLVASAITDKGVSTSSDATFEIMAQNIEAIPTGSDFDMTVTDNQVKMVIEVGNYDLSFWTRFGISGGGTVTVDWGDGLIETFSGNSTLLYAPQRKHNYQEAGKYLITETIENGTLTIGSSSGYSTLSEGKVLNDYNMSDKLRRTYNSKVKALSYGDNIIVYGGFSNIPAINFYNPIGDPVYVNYTASNVIKIKNGVTSIPDFGLNETTALIVKFPKSISQVGAYAFARSSICVFDFTETQLNENGELPITFAETNVFNGISNSSILLFATQEIAEVAKTTTNLSQHASKIKYVGEV